MPNQPIDIDHAYLDAIRERHIALRGIHKLADLMDSNYVGGEGYNPKVMLVGEAPGATEDIRRRPFVGLAGVVLRELMSFAGLYTGGTPELGQPNCWLTNTVKFRPPRNRNPTSNEIKIFRPLLRAEWIAVGRPRVVIPIGGIAFSAIFGKPMGILGYSGKPIYRTSRCGIPMTIWPMVHPAFVMRQRSEQLQELVEKDWEQLGRWLNDRLH